MTAIMPKQRNLGVEEGRASVDAWKYKTQMCANFSATGKCRYSNRCMFAHGEHELRSISLNRTEGVTSIEGVRRYRKVLKQHARARREDQIAYNSSDYQVHVHEIDAARSVYTHNPYGFRCCIAADITGCIYYPEGHPCSPFSTATHCAYYSGCADTFRELSSAEGTSDSCVNAPTDSCDDLTSNASTDCNSP